LSIGAEDLPPEALQQVLIKSGLVQDPQSQQLPLPGMGQGGNKVGPVDVGLQRELGLMAGLQTPPNMPEIGVK
jgi:hypothetical protein